MKVFYLIAALLTVLAAAFFAGYYLGSRPVVMTTANADRDQIQRLGLALGSAQDSIEVLRNVLQVQRQRVRQDSTHAAEAIRNARRLREIAEEQRIPYPVSDSLLAAEASRVAASRLPVASDAIQPLPFREVVAFALPRIALEDYVTLATVTLPRYRVTVTAYETALAYDSVLISSMALEASVLRRSVATYDAALDLHRRKDEAQTRLTASLEAAYWQERRHKRVLMGTSLGLTTLFIIHLVK